MAATRAIRAAGEVVSAATSSMPERAQAAQTATGALSTVRDADVVIRRDDVDVVHVCTPNASHEAYAERALEAGKWVVCEKPLAVSSAAASCIGDSARADSTWIRIPFSSSPH